MQLPGEIASIDNMPVFKRKAAAGLILEKSLASSGVARRAYHGYLVTRMPGSAKIAFLTLPLSALVRAVACLLVLRTEKQQSTDNSNKVGRLR
jgi:hypothetical protein